jgi:hypothetical protein
VAKEALAAAAEANKLKDSGSVAAKKPTLIDKEGRLIETKPDKIALELSATQKATVIFRAEGQPMGTFAMKPGESIKLQADQEANLFVDNPTALKAKLNGKEISLGEKKLPRQIVLTPQGIDESRSQEHWADFERKMRELKMHVPQVALPAPPATSGATRYSESEMDAAARAGIGSRARQRELAQTPGSARVFLTSPGIPEILTVIVRVDNETLFRRDGRALQREPGQGKIQLREIRPIPLNEELFLPPGAKTFQVYIGYASRRLGAMETVSGEFRTGQRRTLRIELKREAAAGSGERTGHPFTLTLE